MEKESCVFHTFLKLLKKSEDKNSLQSYKVDSYKGSLNSLNNKLYGCCEWSYPWKSN